MNPSGLCCSIPAELVTNWMAILARWDSIVNVQGRRSPRNGSGVCRVKGVSCNNIENIETEFTFYTCPLLWRGIFFLQIMDLCTPVYKGKLTRVPNYIVVESYEHEVCHPSTVNQFAPTSRYIETVCVCMCAKMQTSPCARSVLDSDLNQSRLLCQRLLFQSWIRSDQCLNEIRLIQRWFDSIKKAISLSWIDQGLV